MDAHRPEPYIAPAPCRTARIDPDDFLEDAPVRELGKRGPKHKDHCKAGHPYARFGRLDADGSRRCRKCQSIAKMARYRRMKGAA